MNKSLPVFRKGSWIQVPLPVVVDPLWSNSNLFQMASVYATARSKGVSPSESAVLAECFVHKQVYTDLQYSTQLEKKLRSLLKDPEGTT